MGAVQDAAELDRDHGIVLLTEVADDPTLDDFERRKAAEDADRLR
ncbi:hypothetical protein ACQPZP_39835 [Spirillospora sp. CA-142024]